MPRINITSSPKRYDKSALKSIFGDFDKDGTINIDDVSPLNNKVRATIEKNISMGDVFESVLDLRNKLDESMRDVVSELDSMSPKDAEIYARTKTPFSIFKKLVDKRLTNPDKGLTDLVGTTIATKDFADLQRVAKQIQSGALGKVIDFEDFYAHPKDGYRAYHFIVLRNGVPIEVQLKTKRQKEINKLSHAAYKKGTLNAHYLQDLTALADEADKGDVKAQKEIDYLLSTPSTATKLSTAAHALKLEGTAQKKFEEGGLIYNPLQSFTVSDGKIGCKEVSIKSAKMQKPHKFVVCPTPESSDIIFMQSDKKSAVIYPEQGFGVISKRGHRGSQLIVDIIADRAEYFTFTPNQIKTLENNQLIMAKSKTPPKTKQRSSKKFELGGLVLLSPDQKEEFIDWIEEGNAHQNPDGTWTEQTTQWSKPFTLPELEYFYWNKFIRPDLSEIEIEQMEEKISAIRSKNSRKENLNAYVRKTMKKGGVIDQLSSGLHNMLFESWFDFSNDHGDLIEGTKSLYKDVYGSDMPSKMAKELEGDNGWKSLESAWEQIVEKSKTLTDKKAEQVYEKWQEEIQALEYGRGGNIQAWYRDRKYTSDEGHEKRYKSIRKSEAIGYRGSKKEFGGTVDGIGEGSAIAFRYGRDNEIREGLITSELPSGNFEVVSGLSYILVSPSDIVSKIPMRKARAFRFFEKGGNIGADKWHKVMSEFKDGKLRSGQTGNVVTDKQQALAIAYSEARKVDPRYAVYELGGNVTEDQISSFWDGEDDRSIARFMDEIEHPELTSIIEDDSVYKAGGTVSYKPGKSKSDLIKCVSTGKYGLGGLITGTIIGSYLGYKYGRTMPMKEDVFALERKIASSLTRKK